MYIYVAPLVKAKVIALFMHLNKLDEPSCKYVGRHVGGRGVDRTDQFRHHPLASPDVMV